MTSSADHIEILRNLQKEILLNPDMRHRIILKAIKTAESKEVRKTIREFCRSSFLINSPFKVY